MKVELLHLKDCPNAKRAKSKLSAALDHIASGTPIEQIEVGSQKEADQLNFMGSPSIRINGEDLEGRRTDRGVFEPRDYGNSGTPERWLIEARLLRATMPRHILFLCVANSARSQMGEGIARKLAPPHLKMQSAGSHPTSVRPEAAIVLRELGIDPSGQVSKNVTEIDPKTVNTVITLCREEECPLFLGDAVRLHWGLPDPAAVTGDDVARRDAFRAARNELAKRLSAIFDPSSA